MTQILFDTFSGHSSDVQATTHTPEVGSWVYDSYGSPLSSIGVVGSDGAYRGTGTGSSTIYYSYLRSENKSETANYSITVTGYSVTSPTSGGWGAYGRFDPAVSSSTALMAEYNNGKVSLIFRAGTSSTLSSVTVPISPIGEKHTITLDMNADRIRVIFDNIEVISIKNSSNLIPSYGGIFANLYGRIDQVEIRNEPDRSEFVASGVATSEVTGEYTYSRRRFFRDTFESESSRELSRHTPVMGGAWSIMAMNFHQMHVNVPGGYAYGSSSQNSIADPAAMPFYKNSVTPPSADYMVKAKVWKTTIGPTGQTGVLGRVQPDGKTFYAVYESNGTVYLDKFINGSQTRLGSFQTSWPATTTFPPEESFIHEISIWMEGTTIRAIVDNKDVISVTDSAITGAGNPGIVARLSGRIDEVFADWGAGDNAIGAGGWSRAIGFASSTGTGRAFSASNATSSAIGRKLATSIISITGKSKAWASSDNREIHTFDNFDNTRDSRYLITEHLPDRGGEWVQGNSHGGYHAWVETDGSVSGTLTSSTAYFGTYVIPVASTAGRAYSVSATISVSSTSTLAMVVAYGGTTNQTSTGYEAGYYNGNLVIRRRETSAGLTQLGTTIPANWELGRPYRVTLDVQTSGVLTLRVDGVPVMTRIDDANKWSSGYPGIQTHANARIYDFVAEYVPEASLATATGVAGSTFKGSSIYTATGTSNGASACNAVGVLLRVGYGDSDSTAFASAESVPFVTKSSTAISEALSRNDMIGVRLITHEAIATSTASSDAIAFEPYSGAMFSTASSIAIAHGTSEQYRTAHSRGTSTASSHGLKIGIVSAIASTESVANAHGVKWEAKPIEAIAESEGQSSAIAIQPDWNFSMFSVGGRTSRYTARGETITTSTTIVRGVATVEDMSGTAIIHATATAAGTSTTGPRKSNPHKPFLFM